MVIYKYKNMREMMSKSGSIKEAEDKFSVEAVPLDARRPWTYAAAFWVGIWLVLAAFMVGATPLAFLPYNWAMFSIIVSYLVMFFMYFSTGYLGAKKGLNTYLLGFWPFGRYGTIISTVLVASVIMSIGWYGIEAWLGAASIGILAGWEIGGPGKPMDINTALTLTLIAMLSAIPAYIGLVASSVFDFIVIPIILALTGYALNLAFGVGIIGETLRYTPPGWKPELLAPNLAVAMNLLIGASIGGAALGADVGRWIRPTKKGSFLAAFSVYLAAVVMSILGPIFAVAAIKAGLDPSLAWNIVLVFKALGLPYSSLWPLLILVTLLQVTTCLTAAYYSGLALTVAFNKPRLRGAFVLLSAAIGSALGVWGIVWYWIPFLNLLANWVPPAAAIILMHHFVVERYVSFTSIPKVNWAGLLSWLVGGLIAHIIANYAPFLAPAIIGMIAASGLYGIIIVVVKGKQR